MKNRNMTWGVLLILLGILLLVGRLFNFQMFDWSYFWPIFVLIPGLMFEAGYFLSGRGPGLLVPGGIITTIGILFFFENSTNWQFADITWPIYILAVSIGLYQLYLFGGKQRGVFVAASILAIFFVIFASFTFTERIFPWFSSTYVFPAVLILIGIYMLLRNFRNSK
jgi:hypothetical protein